MDMSREYFQSTFKLAEHSAAPIYAQLANYLKHQIQTGVLRQGDKMIGETDMADILKISRTTVRMSLNRLVEEGLLVRYRGKGSYIAEPKLKRNINYLYNFTENIQALGAVASSDVLVCMVAPADERVSAKLQLSREGQEVFILERLRYANGQPLIVERTRVPYYLCPGIESMDFRTASLYAVMRNHYGIRINRAEETIEAVVMSKAECAQFGCKNGMPGYRIERVSYPESGYICEFTTSVTRADKCIFKLDLYHGEASKGSSVDFERKLIVYP